MSFKLAAAITGSWALLATMAMPAVAQSDQQDAIRKAVQSAVQSSVANTIQQTVRQVEVETTSTDKMNTFFSRPTALFLTTGGFAGTGAGTTTTPVVVAPVGVIYNVAPNWFVTGAGTYAHVFSQGTGATDIDFVQGTFGATYVAWHQGEDSIRLNTNFDVGGIFPGRGASRAAFTLTPSVDLEKGMGPWVFTLTPGFGLSWSDPSGTTDPIGQFQLVGKVTYFTGPWAPQLALEYDKLTEGNDTTSGNFSVTPELNYMLDNKRITLGVAYQYKTVLGANFTNYSNAGIVNLRIKF